jgi:hypothetical protein
MRNVTAYSEPKRFYGDTCCSERFAAPGALLLCWQRQLVLAFIFASAPLVVTNGKYFLVRWHSKRIDNFISGSARRAD